MLDEKTRALLGDREAQEAITARWELLPCFCGRNPNLSTTALSSAPGVYATLQCDCGIIMNVYGEVTTETVLKLIRKWNTRAPLLTPEQMAMLGIAREPRKFEEGIK